jgi:formylglycine-generating enzyme required for sulfatase activity
MRRSAMALHYLFVLWLACLVPAQALAQAWPDLQSDAGEQGGGEQDAALVIGVSTYYNLPPIPGAAENAEAWQQWLMRTRKVRPERVVLLADREATKGKIERNLKALAGQVGPRGTLWFVFIGHGAPAGSGDDGMLLGVDTDADADSIAERGVAQRQVLATAAASAGHSVVVFDACFSGRTGDGAQVLVPGLMATLPTRRRPAGEERLTVLAASDSFAGPLPRGERPAFSYLLLGALRGWADTNGDQQVDVGEAHAFTRGTIQALFKGNDRLPQARGNTSAVLARNVQEPQPDMAALIAGRCPSGQGWDGRRCQEQIAAAVTCPAGTSWDGASCVATAVSCPEGAVWNGRVCEAHARPAGATRRDKKTALGWVWIPPGTFHAGCEPQDPLCAASEKPGAIRSVAGFWMLRSEVTVGAYKVCTASRACKPVAPPGFTQGSDHPVVLVDWHEATAFCAWLGGRLPTGVEWEYAAKSGLSRMYPWGDTPPQGRANCAADCGDTFENTAPVGSFPLGDTPWGLKDMAGNVWEWTSTAFDATNKELRGGGWIGTSRNLRASYHIGVSPTYRDGDFGFRCAQ